MRLSRLLLRWSICLGYFLPFTFYVVGCDGSEVAFAYNERERAEMIAKREAYEKANPRKFELDSTTIAKIKAADTVQRPVKKDIERFDAKIVLRYMIMPTDSSLSGFGSIFLFKNTFGRVLMFASMFLSLLLLIPFRFLSKYRIKLYLLCLQTTLLIAFISDCLISEVDTLWGLWLMILLIASQLALELWSLRAAQS